MQNDDLETLRATAIAADKIYSKSRLLDELRLKPKPDAAPVKIVKNGYGGRSPLYRMADCVPIRETAQKEPTPKQLKARAIQAIKSKKRGRLARAGAEAMAWLGTDLCFIDLETTGLGPTAQIVEVAAADQFRNVLFHTTVKPTVPIDPGAINIHGYTEAMLADSPTWPDVIDQFKQVVTGRMVVIFNADYDSRIIQQTCDAFNLSTEWWDEIDTRCAMYLATDAFGATNRYGTISLDNATLEAGVEWTGNAHTAIADTLATVDLVNAIGNSYSELCRQLEELEAATQA